MPRLDLMCAEKLEEGGYLSSHTHTDVGAEEAEQKPILPRT